MKQGWLLISCIVMHLCLYQVIEGCSVGQANRREWVVASIVSTLAQTIKNQTLLLNVVVQQDFNSTFTALHSLNTQAVSLNSLASSIDTQLLHIYSNISTVVSETVIINTEIASIYQSLEDIHLNSFGGTWTALNNLETTIIHGMQTVNAQTLAIESFADSLSVTAVVQFMATATNLQELLGDISATMTAVQALSDQISTDFSEIGSKIMVTDNQLVSTNAQLATMIRMVNYDFASTFTIINAIEQQLINANNRLISFENAWTDSFNDSMSTLALFENELLVINSKLDSALVLTSNMQSTANGIIN